jgi:hypothetical protein
MPLLGLWLGGGTACTGLAAKECRAVSSLDGFEPPATRVISLVVFFAFRTCVAVKFSLTVAPWTARALLRDQGICLRGTSFMTMFKSVARRSARAFAFSCLPVLFLFISLQSEAAFSASLTMKVRQLNDPAGAVQETTCTDPQNCSLDLSLQAGSKKETLAVRAFHVPGSTLFTFHTPDGYLYAAAKTQADPKNPVYMATWGSGAKTGAAAISDITLYGPPVPIAMGANGGRCMVKLMLCLLSGTRKRCELRRPHPPLGSISIRRVQREGVLASDGTRGALLG